MIEKVLRLVVTCIVSSLFVSPAALLVYILVADNLSQSDTIVAYALMLPISLILLCAAVFVCVKMFRKDPIDNQARSIHVMPNVTDEDTIQI